MDAEFLTIVRCVPVVERKASGSGSPTVLRRTERTRAGRAHHLSGGCWNGRIPRESPVAELRLDDRVRHFFHFLGLDEADRSPKCAAGRELRVRPFARQCFVTTMPLRPRALPADAQRLALRRPPPGRTPWISQVRTAAHGDLTGGLSIDRTCRHGPLISQAMGARSGPGRPATRPGIGNGVAASLSNAAVAPLEPTGISFIRCAVGQSGERYPDASWNPRLPAHVDRPAHRVVEGARGLLPPASTTDAGRLLRCRPASVRPGPLGAPAEMRRPPWSACEVSRTTVAGDHAAAFGGSGAWPAGPESAAPRRTARALRPVNTRQWAPALRSLTGRRASWMLTCEWRETFGKFRQVCRSDFLHPPVNRRSSDSSGL